MRVRHPARLLAGSLGILWLLVIAAISLGSTALVHTDVETSAATSETRIFVVHTVTLSPGMLLRIDAPSFASADVELLILEGGEGAALASGQAPTHIYRHVSPPHGAEPVWFERPVPPADAALPDSVDVVWTVELPAEGADDAGAQALLNADDVSYVAYSPGGYFGGLVAGAAIAPAALVVLGAVVLWARAGAPAEAGRYRIAVAILGAFGVGAALLVARSLVAATFAQPAALGLAPWWGVCVTAGVVVAALATGALWWRALGANRRTEADAPA